MRTFIVIGIIMMLTGVLNGEADTLKVQSGKTELWVMGAFCVTELHRSWNAEMGHKLGFWGTRHIDESFNANAGLHLHHYRMIRYVPHPYTHVIAMRERVSTLKLRLPVSLYVKSDPRYQVVPNFGLGLYLDTPVWSRRKETRDLISEIQIHNYNTTETYPTLSLGYSIHLAWVIDWLLLELRWSNDLTSSDLPWLRDHTADAGRKTTTKHTDFAVIMNYRLF